MEMRELIPRRWDSPVDCTSVAVAYFYKNLCGTMLPPRCGSCIVSVHFRHPAASFYGYCLCWFCNLSYRRVYHVACAVGGNVGVKHI